MPTYILPQVLVFQEFELSPAAVANPLRAHISGPHAHLARYSDEDERAGIFVGYYDYLLEECHEWPGRPAGAEIDDAYTKVWVEDALLQYFEDTVGSGSDITKTAANKVSSDSVNFAENGTTYPRDASLLDRDVQIGDVVKVRGVPGVGDPVTVWSYVSDIEGEIVDDVIGAADGDDDNAATQLASSSITKTDGVDNCVTAVEDGSAYDGLADGDISETYTVIVLESSTGGDHTTATLRVLSASGNDDVAEVTPSAAGVATAIGTRGLTVTFDEADTAACSASASEDGVSPDDLIAGQTWEVEVAQAFTAPTATSGGDYTGDLDTTYIIEVTRGGLYTDTNKPQITVTTTNGVDIAAAKNVTAAATAVAVGTEGVTVSFDATGLRKGDRYYIEVTAEAEGPMRTLVLAHNIPSTVSIGDECDVTLFIRKPLLQLTENREGFAPLVNWTQSDTEICLQPNIMVFDESWTDGGVPEALPLKSEDSQEYGKVYIEYRGWLCDLGNTVEAISDVGELNDQISGALDPDNPLKWGVFKALSNSNGVDVKYTAVCDPDDDDAWAAVLELLLGRDDVYGLVPLTRRRTVLDLFAAHVAGQSTPEEGLWRVAWFNLEGVPEIPLVHAGSTVVGHTTATTDDGLVAKATITDDPDTSGTQYTIVEDPNGNANFITNGVRAGDIVRTLYTSDGFGGVTYSEYVVDAVLTEDSLRLLTGPSAAINVASKIEVWRNLSATEEAAEIAVDAGSYNNRRIMAVWPDQIESSGTIQEGYHLCAALAGLASGVLPHQGLTNVEIAGFSDVARTIDKFNKPQLDTMAVAGVWIVTQDPVDGEIFTRHAVTTGDYEDASQREEMITRNVDSISYRFKDHFAPFIGVSNVTPSMLRLIALETGNLITVLRTERVTQRLGGQLIDGSILELRPHATLRDRLVMALDIEVPFPLNNLEIHLVI